MTEPKRILLVEDDELNRQIVFDYLSNFGDQVLSLTGGTYFFQTLVEFQPHLIVLNLKLPDVDGYTLLEQLQQDPKKQRIPVVVLSALAFKAEQQRALSLGIRCYLVKPMNLTDLLEVIQAELHKGSYS